MNTIHVKRAWPVLLLLWVALASCEKKIMETIPVMQVVADMSIAGATAIRHFSFPSAQVGYAAENAAYIYKTTDGGKVWAKMQVGTGGTCNGLEFFDELNGMCLMGQNLYITGNGGQTWQYQDRAHFIGITDTGKGVLGYAGGYQTCDIKLSSNKGKTFQAIGNVKVEGDFDRASITGTKIFVLGKNANFDGIYSIDTETKAKARLLFKPMIYTEAPTAIFMNELKSVLVGTSGKLLEPIHDEVLWPSYYGHQYPYYAVHGYQDLVVAVGEKTVSHNRAYTKDGKWSELLDAQGRSFTHTFYKIRFIDSNSFYISGSNGLLWKARI